MYSAYPEGYAPYTKRCAQCKMTTNQDNIVIKLSKTKLVLLSAGAVAFVFAGLWLMTIADSQTRFDALFVKAICIASISISGLSAVYGLAKLFDNEAGLTLNQSGLLDNSSAVSAGEIKWTDIASFEIIQMKSTRFLLIFVSNPDDYLDRVNGFKRFFMKMNQKLYGTPITISSTSLQCDFDQLIEAVDNKINTVPNKG